jgi:hypothetical protein
VQTDQTLGHLIGDFAREVTRDSGQYRERAGRNSSLIGERAWASSAEGYQLSTGRCRNCSACLRRARRETQTRHG